MIKNGVDLSKFKEITNVDFSNDNPHLAIVHKDQGGAANGWHQSLLTKSEDVKLSAEIIKSLEQITVTMSFEEFLRKFFDMWYHDAELLAKTLGYKTEYEYYQEKYAEDGEESEGFKVEFVNDETTITDSDGNNIDITPTGFLEEQVEYYTLMKSAESAKDIPQDKYLSILNLQQNFEKGVKQFDIAFEEDTPTKSEGVVIVAKSTETKKDSSPSDKQSKKKEDPLDIQELMKSAEGQALIQKMAEDSAKEMIEKAEADVVAAQEAGKEELAKATDKLEKASEELSGFREEKEARRKDGMVGLVKSLTFVAAEDSEQLVEELMKGSKAEAMDMKVIVAQLEKAQEAVEKAKSDFVASEEGVELKDEVKDVAKSAELADALAEKYAGKKFLD